MDPCGYILGLSDRPFPLQVGRRLRFGRGPDNDLVFNDNLCSRNHAVLEAKQDGVFLKDLGSTNRTWLNEFPIHPHRPTPMKSGDIFRIGGYVLTFVVNTAEVAPAIREQDEEMKKVSLTPELAASVMVTSQDEDAVALGVPRRTTPLGTTTGPVLSGKMVDIAGAETDADLSAEKTAHQRPTFGQDDDVEFAMRGELSKMAFPQLLIVIHHAKRSGTLTLEHGVAMGLVGFNDGKIFYAELESQTGVPALEAMAKLQDGTYVFKSKSVRQTPNIDLPMTRILLRCRKAMAAAKKK